MYYFAYGSNMNHKQMQERCPGSRFIKTVYLKNGGFRYDGRSGKWENKAVANITSVEAGKVWGGLFEINENDLKVLDIRYEGYPKSYGKGMIKVYDSDGTLFEAWTYFRIGERQGQPCHKYRAIVHQGAIDCNLPVEYIQNNIGPLA